MTETETRIIRVQGVPVRVPDGMLMQPSPAGQLCEATEPEWPDGSGGEVVCCLPVHKTGRAGLAHIANDAGSPVGNIIAIWWDATAIPGDNDI